MQNLERMRELTAGTAELDGVTLVWLLGCMAEVTDAQLEALAMIGNGIGPDKVLTYVH